MKLTAQATKASIGIYTESGRRVATMNTGIVDTGMPQWSLATQFSKAPAMLALLKEWLERVPSGTVSDSTRELIASIEKD